ncbi:MAG: dTDP-glucose 4,6-dehydratase [Candidatus Brocadiales bacterium]|nr:dTDP-glucose 4,6-dehydratase [Candidatus Bathyanammoxibius sp.]
MSTLITGGAGFIGSHLTRLFLEMGTQVSVLDKLTYAGSLENLKGCMDRPGFRFYRGDVCNRGLVEHVMDEARPENIVHLAAETHVDRSITGAGRFLETNVMGTHSVLEAARRHGVRRFVLVSTDEVYGECLEGSKKETDPLRPRNPYSASKAAQEHLAYSYLITHGVPVVTVRGCNNYGPSQYPEKFIPKVITNAISGRPVPLYGHGLQTREWIYVTDFAAAIALIMDKGSCGEVYNVGSGAERKNLAVAEKLLDELGASRGLITHVQDRLGHDRRYAIDSTRVRGLGWRPETSFDEGIKQTVGWFKRNGCLAV